MIRPATPADAHAIAEVHTRAWWRAYQDILDASFMAGRAEGREERWATALADEAAPTLVAEVADAIAGFVTYGPARGEDAEPAEGELYALYVDPAAQGAGVGGALLEAAVTAMRERGWTSASLTVYDANGHAREFYEARGWTHDGRPATIHHGAAAVRYEREL